MFYDPRCGGFRTKLEFTVIDTAPPQSISAVFKEGMVCRPFSITISKKKQDIPTSYFPSAMTFLESVSVEGFFGGERGAREKRLNTMLSYMISTGEYMPVTKCTVNGQGNCLDWQNAQLLWEALMAPEMVTRADTARLFFRCSDPGDHGAPARR